MKRRATCCHADVINYGNVTYTDFIRTETLCRGGMKQTRAKTANAAGAFIDFKGW